MDKVAAKDSKSTATSHINAKGIGWLMGAVFIVGETAGGGMIALPYALTSLGLIPGLILIALCALFCTYTGLELAWAWKIMQNRWHHHYTNHCRKPYGEIGYRAIGAKTRAFIAIMLCATQLGFATVLALLAAKNLSILAHFFFSAHVNQCYLIVLVGLIVWPLTMLESPMHFWQVALFSAGSSTLAVVLLVIGITHDAPMCTQQVAHEPPNLFKACMAFGTLVFAYGGHATLPTIQHDLKKPAHFVYSVLLAQFLVTTYYFLVSIGGYIVYGSTVGDTIIPSIQLMWIQQTVNLMITVHVITTIVIVLSPPIQQIEQILKVEHKFGFPRFIVRTILFWSVIFIGLSLPHFGPLLDLIGASTMTLMTLILPPIFYLSLRTQELKWSAGEEHEQRPSFSEIIEHTPKAILVLNACVLVFGIIGGTAATITSIIKLADSEMPSPCYIQYFTQGLPFSGDDIGAVSCCGTYRNITVSGEDPLGYCSNIH